MADITPGRSSNFLTTPSLAAGITAIVMLAIFFLMAHVYDLGVKQGQIGALKTAYEVCKKVAPLKDGEGCK